MELEEKEKAQIRISVRNLVEFVMRSGDIDNRRSQAPDQAMQEGGRIHRMIQRRMGADYHAEVALRHRYETEEYVVIIEGRADGIIDGTETSPATVDEIKGTYQELKKIKGAYAVHLAQAKCYAYIYAAKNELKEMNVRMTYCNMDTEELKYFHSEYTFPELKEWFDDLLIQYRKWTDFEFHWKKERQQSIKSLSFPFPYREGQKDLVTYVYQSIYHKKKLFIEAPTGVGKTISTVFPAVKAMGEGMGDRIFYLTAKTITRTVADDTFQLLREKGLQMKSVILTAKDKICFMEETECNPEYCPYAKGHYDRINEAIYDLLTKSDNFGRTVIEQYAMAHRVCPFELCLDMSLFSDAVICDYNYVFDPHVYLKRFFSDGVSGEYIFLIDEAHNLVERGREMYSAVLCKEDFLRLKKSVAAIDSKIEHYLEKCNKELLLLKRECTDYKIEEYISPFVLDLQKLGGAMETYLEEHDGHGEVHNGEVREEILEFYFAVSHFLDIYERVDDNYVVYSQLCEDGSFLLKLFCVNPSLNLKECMKKGRSTVLFSATLLPIQYYKSLLGGDAEDYEVYAKSVFDPERKALFIGSDVTSRYARRTEDEYYNIASYIYEIVKNRHGNYMIFFPSHAFLQKVYGIFEAEFMDKGPIECILQEDRMDEQEREEFLNRFSWNDNCDFSEAIQMDIEMEEDKSLLGFCVLGGIFSEGIDLKNDSLIGAMIVGTGLPLVCNEREILKDYFDERGGSGFDYAYRYPGMNKVLQAAGRVIRTAEDVGIVALLDDRFLGRVYQKMFPREWEHFEVVTEKNVARRVERFWDGWL
ncbi:ATP-dependent DNA helicase [Kineothrix sp. MB12-C1]|uniref:ATP-dependent DNA helicase n=1 Tax=Kineothrix sp. MB12-C1 TaxID=3070215 RepID=UPI0027D28D1D|nr:ATP-dependent DNA helicase [Kineothrix sp. MB12-C1]WMC94499.1 ATP-dependent DNA helicase [Kineothrix sp. MB12-C1]